WILPHGVTEILALIICAGAGLALGQALLFPGPYRRLDNLARAGRNGAVVVLGAACLFFIAGLIEGIFRQSVTNVVIRCGVALLTLLFWIAYFRLGHKQGESRASS
ncbi:MAG: stage II sporulation protein M, partial [Planctomycetota bacterium]